MGAGAVSIPMDTSGGLPGGGMDADFSSALGDAFDSATSAGGDSAPSGGTADPALQTAGNADLFPTEVAPVVDGQPNAQPQATADPAASPYQLSADGNFYQVPKGELPQFQNAHKFHQAVSQIFQTPQEAQSASLQAADHRIMSNDWASGSDESLQRFINHFAGHDHSANPQMQQRFQQSFSRMATMLPETLKQVNPQAYESMGAAIVTGRIEAAYQKAATTGNAEDFKSAQEMDYGFTGQYKQDLSQVQKQTPQMSAEAQRMKEFESREANALKRDIGDFNQSAVEGPKFKQFGDMLDKTLAKIKGNYPEEAFNDLKAGIHRELIDTMKNQPDSWWTEHTQEWQRLMDDYRQVWKTGGDVKFLQPRVQSYAQSFVSRAQRLLPSIAQKRIGAATQAQARTRTGQYAAPQPQTGQPAPAAAQQPSNGRISSDQWNKEWASEFGSF